MKKFIVYFLLASILAFIVYYSYMSFIVSTPQKPTNQQSSVGKTVKQGQLGEVKVPETGLDMQQAIDYEKTRNKDTVGWLRIPDSKINFSILQSDNNAYYLETNERREKDVYGSCFADYQCSLGTREEMSANTIIYGHSDLKDNPDGPKFSQLFKFTDQSYALKTPYIFFSTLQEEMVWEVFAVSYTDTKLDYINPHINDKELEALVKAAKSRSIYNYDVSVSGADKIITLSTCTVKFGESKEQRLIVMAKLLPPNTALNPQAALSINPNPLSPKL